MKKKKRKIVTANLEHAKLVSSATPRGKDPTSSTTDQDHELPPGAAPDAPDENASGSDLRHFIDSQKRLVAAVTRYLRELDNIHSVDLIMEHLSLTGKTSVAVEAMGENGRLSSSEMRAWLKAQMPIVRVAEKRLGQYFLFGGEIRKNDLKVVADWMDQAAHMWNAFADGPP